MEKFSIKSTSIQAIGWEEGKLRIDFNNGTVYEYNDVPRNVFSELLNAKSPGKIFQSLVRPKYQGRKVEVGE